MVDPKLFSEPGLLLHGPQVPGDGAGLARGCRRHLFVATALATLGAIVSHELPRATLGWPFVGCLVFPPMMTLLYTPRARDGTAGAAGALSALLGIADKMAWGLA